MVGPDREAFLRAAWVNVVGNLLKILVEGSVGLYFGSLALVADAVHSIADLLASAVVLIWGRLSFVGPDEDHPHGHERVEPLTALFVGATLIALAGTLLYEARNSLIGGPEIEFSGALVAGLGFAGVSMGAVCLYTVRVNERLDSPGLAALAADCRNDIYTTLAAAVGVAGIAAGYPAADALAGAGVAVLVLYEGGRIVHRNLGYLVGRAPSEAERRQVREAILSHPAVEGIHDLRVYYIGTDLEVEFHAEIDAEFTLREAHRIETELNERVLDVEGVGDAHVHLDPSGLGEWKDADEDGREDPDC